MTKIPELRSEFNNVVEYNTTLNSYTSSNQSAIENTFTIYNAIKILFCDLIYH